MKKRVAKSSVGPMGGLVHLAPLESTLFGSVLPFLQHLSIVRWDDGTPRTPGTAILKTDGASWKCVLKEPDAKLQLPLMAATFDDLIALAALSLEGEEAPWEHDKWAYDRAKPGKKSS